MSDCHGLGTRIQADLDGELDALASAELAAHVEECQACAAIQAQLSDLSQRLRLELPRDPAPAELRSVVVARLARAAETPRTRVARSPWFSWRPLAGFVAGAALAASLALIVMPDAGGSGDVLVAAHVRALQPGHLIDVASSDQHTVKPWFNGRLDYTPPVKDLAAAGFPLVGGRLDSNGRRAVAVLVYRRDRHLIDLFAWPDDAAAPLPPGSPSAVGDGFVQVGWRSGGMALRAMSDLNPAELADFVRLWQLEP